MAKKRSNKEAVRGRLAEKQTAKKKKIAIVLSVLGIAVAVGLAVFLADQFHRARTMKEPEPEPKDPGVNEFEDTAQDPDALGAVGWWWSDENSCFQLSADRWFSAYSRDENGLMQQDMRVRCMLFDDYMLLDTDPAGENPTRVPAVCADGVFTLDGVAFHRGEAPKGVEK